jgi:hypothetical protein
MGKLLEAIYAWLFGVNPPQTYDIHGDPPPKPFP